MTRAELGRTPTGQRVERLTLQNERLSVEVLTYGARIARVLAPDRDGQRDDVVLGYDSLLAYERDTSYLGAVIGRYAGRIAGGRFVLDGRHYQVSCDDREHALHGGDVGFDRKVWDARALPDGVELTLTSPDGDMGFPGALTIQLSYTLAGDALRVRYTATADAPTIVNLTSHAYFNLEGHRAGSILAHELEIPATQYVPVKDGLIPTGELAHVAGTPFDFRTATGIGQRVGNPHPQLALAGGYDHSWVLGDPGVGKLAARVHGSLSGRTLAVTTTEPSVHLYCGNFLEGTRVCGGDTSPGRRAGICLETQHLPDSPNQPTFPSVVLRPGETRNSETTFTFGVSR